MSVKRNVTIPSGGVIIRIFLIISLKFADVQVFGTGIASTRKRTVLVIAVFLGLTFGVAADGLEVGPSAMLRFPFTVDDSLSASEGMGIEDFKIGADLELGLGALQLGALFDYKPGREEDGLMVPPSIEAFVTGGLLFDLALIRLGAGIGPTFIFDIPAQGGSPSAPETQSGPGPMGLGLGVKANADVVLGPIALRLNVISGLDLLRMAVADDALQYMDVKLGLSALFRF